VLIIVHADIRDIKLTISYIVKIVTYSFIKTDL
jgi:hypothetical protein